MPDTAMWVTIVLVAVVSSFILLVVQDWFNQYIIRADPLTVQQGTPG